MSERPLPPPRHEARDVTSRLLWPVGAIMFGMVLFALAVSWWAFPAARRPPHLPDQAQTFAAPRLQRSARDDMAALKAREDAELNSYGWIDRKRGIVHVPIEQAMRKLAADGIPGWPAPEMPR